MTIKRFIGIIILIPITIAVILFSVANRASISVNFDLFGLSHSSLIYHAPLFIWLFIALIIGILIGGLLVWLSQWKQHKALQ